MRHLKENLTSQLDESSNDVLEVSIFVEPSKLNNDKYLIEMFRRVIDSTNYELHKKFGTHLTPDKTADLTIKAMNEYSRYK